MLAVRIREPGESVPRGDELLGWVRASKMAPPTRHAPSGRNEVLGDCKPAASMARTACTGVNGDATPLASNVRNEFRGEGRPVASIVRSDILGDVTFWIEPCRCDAKPAASACGLTIGGCSLCVRQAVTRSVGGGEWTRTPMASARDELLSVPLIGGPG